jgi:hypothetical protein
MYNYPLNLTMEMEVQNLQAKCKLHGSDRGPIQKLNYSTKFMSTWGSIQSNKIRTYTVKE